MIKYLPKSLWSENTLYLPASLTNSHWNFLVKNGWQSKYQPKSSGLIGGADKADADDHVINRFLNSAARMQFVCSDPRREHPEVRQMILDQLASGQIFLLDVASGNGSGTLAILALICELREHKIVPKLPLNISIFGLDISPDSLNYYTELLSDITPWLQASGINVKLDLNVCNLNISGETDQILENFFNEAKISQCNRFLCTVSALSGVRQEGMQKMMDSLKLIAARLSHKNRCSSWLWVEPKVEKTWLGGFAETISQTFQQLVHFFIKTSQKPEADNTQLSTQEARVFHWLDPHNAHLTKSHVVVMQFKNT